jgi:hypothetical protein
MPRRYSFSPVPSEQAARALEEAGMLTRELQRLTVAAGATELMRAAYAAAKAVAHAAESVKTLRQVNAELRQAVAERRVS